MLTVKIAINKSPMMLNQSKDAQDLEAGVIEDYNNILATRLGDFVALHAGARGMIVDTQAPFDAAINNPTKYGSKDAICYNSDGKTCLWFNDYHPGLAINRLVAEALVRTWNNTVFFKSLATP